MTTVLDATAATTRAVRGSTATTPKPRTGGSQFGRPSHLTPAGVESIVSATTEQLFRRRDALPRDDGGRPLLRARIIEVNLPMARRLAHRYTGRGEALDDLAQVAALGLVKAVDGYDSRRDCLFVSYAVPSILGALKRHFRDAGWGMRVPRATQELVLLVRATSDELCHRLGRLPSPVELADHLDIALDQLRAAQAAVHAYRPGSLEASLSSVDGGGAALARALGVTEPGYAVLDNQLLVRALVAALPDRERRIVTMRFHDEMTQSQIAAVIGVSQMQVSRLLRQCMDHLRIAMSAPGRPVVPAEGRPRARR